MRPKTRLNVGGAWTVCPGGATVEQYSPRSDSWSPVASLPRRRLQFAVAVVGRRVYVVGGRDGLRTLDVVQSFDVSSRAWSTVTAMNTHRHGLGQYSTHTVHSSTPVTAEPVRHLAIVVPL